MIVECLWHVCQDGVARRYYYMRTEVQPLGYVIALPWAVCGYDEHNKVWMIGQERWPNVLEICTATAQEVEDHWNELQPVSVEAARLAFPDWRGRV